MYLGGRGGEELEDIGGGEIIIGIYYERKKSIFLKKDKEATNLGEN